MASVYAEVFHRLGYLAVSHPVSAEWWQEMTSNLRTHFENHDVSQSEAGRILGEPSLVIDQRILCYAPAAPAAGWLFIDCQAEHSRHYDVGHGRYTAAADPSQALRRPPR